MSGKIRLGYRQLERLRGVGTTRAQMVPDAMSRRLCALGLMRAHGEDGGFAAITPVGLRFLADAVEAGRISLFEMPTKDGR